MARGHPDYLTFGGKTEEGEELVDWRFLINNGERILKRVFITTDDTTATIYTVPTGKVLYVVACSIGYNKNSDGGSSGSIGIYVDDVATPLLTMFDPAVTGLKNSSVSFPIPIVCVAGEDILSRTIGDATLTASIQGYEIDV